MKLLLLLTVFINCSLFSQDLFILPDNVQTGWSSFENPKALKGQGGKENKGAKGHPADIIQPGQNKVLLDISGAGTIQRMWLTLSDRSPQMLRSMKIEMYWDGETKPAVSIPIGDFFSIGLGRTTVFQNAFFSNPEGRSFNCNIPMPFRKGAKVVLTNESNKPQTLFYDINFVKVTKQPENALYFHAFWNRNINSRLGEDFEILPSVTGKGRFLGCNLGIIADSLYGRSWWGEGEVKIYLDGDKQFPTLVGTGTEDYIGTAWGQGAYAHFYQGCPIADTTNRQWAFYRYHIPDPVYFYNACKVTIQQMGGDMTEVVKRIVQGGARLIPVTVSTASDFIKLLEMNQPPKISDTDFPSGWTNFYRLDNYSSTAYFYLDKPSNSLPPLASLSVRIEGILNH